VEAKSRLGSTNPKVEVNLPKQSGVSAILLADQKQYNQIIPLLANELYKFWKFLK